jgi:hypothetical protein
VFLTLSNDKLLLIFFYFFCIFPSFISNTSTVIINFRANLDAQNAGNGISGLQISTLFWGMPVSQEICPPPLRKFGPLKNNSLLYL